MKTNKFAKLMIALLAALTLFCLTTTAFAATERGRQAEKTKPQAETSKQSAPAPEQNSRKDGKNRPERPMMYDDDRFEDWFEDRIDQRRHDVDFSKLPDNATDKEMLEFFMNNFMSESSKQQNSSKPERPMKKDRKADRFEDWFEDKIDNCEHHVDFSQLGENPTDEEIVEFFRNNLMGKGSGWTDDGKFDEDAMKDYSFTESGKPFSGHKTNPRHPYQPNPEQEPITGQAPDPEQTPITEAVPENNESESESIEPTPVEQPTEEGAEQAPAEQPAEENIKDKA